jgi:O-antigen ligase
MYTATTFERFRAVAVLLFLIASALAFICSHQAQSPFECIVMAKDEHGVVLHDKSEGESNGMGCESWVDCVTKTNDYDDEFVCEKPGWFKTFTVAQGRVRWRGTLADPNELSLAIGVAVSFAFAIHASAKRWWRHLFLASALALTGYCIVCTGSRGGQLVLLAILGTYFVRRFGAKGLVLGAVLAAPVLLLGGRHGEDADASTLERLGALYTGMDFVKNNPILGLGQGQFVQNYFITAHNSYVLSAAELGFPGMLLWSSFMYSSVKIPYVLATRPPPGLDPRLVPYAFALVTSFAGIFVGIFFLSFCYHDLLFVYCGLAGALFLAARRTCPWFEVKVSGLEIGVLAAIDATLLAALFVYTRIKGAP